MKREREREKKDTQRKTEREKRRQTDRQTDRVCERRKSEDSVVVHHLCILYPVDCAHGCRRE